MIWTARQLEEALGVKVNPNAGGNRLQFNSRDVEKGDMFIALQGENGDGHDYIKDALAKGANAIICKDSHYFDISSAYQGQLTFVSDTHKALNQLAAYKRHHSKAKFIGITGSSGKTSTKDALAVMLQPFGRIFASRGTFNNDLGVPLNLASMPDDIDYAVFEMGMNHIGEIRELTRIVKPDIAIITTIASAHLEFFQSVESIADAKAEIFTGLPANGIAILNLDNNYYRQLASNLQKLPGPPRSYSFGQNMQANARLKLYENFADKVRLIYVINEQEVEAVIPVIPRHFAKNFAACLMAISALNLDIKTAINQISKISIPEGRGNIISIDKGGKKLKIIQDYYNANPESMQASLEYLKEMPHAKKVVIIGDMLELGEHSAQLHKNLVPAIIAAGARKILLVGSLTANIKNDFPEDFKIYHFDVVAGLIEKLDDLVEDGELILIKGSNSIKLGAIIDLLRPYLANGDAIDRQD